MKILILGDVHGVWGDLNIVIARALRQHPDITAFVQVGDLGFGFSGTKPFEFHETFMDPSCIARARSIPFYWLDGNHDNHELLEKDQGASQPGMTYQPRGSIHDFGWPFGRAMFFGGASSIDKSHRTEGKDWWAGESITYGQTAKALETEGPIDMIFSHEFPLAFPYGSYKKTFGESDKQALDALRIHFKPKFWIFGHHHHYQSGTTDGTQWACAPCIEEQQAILWDGDTLTLLDCSKKTKSRGRRT